jgi:hypothetical protein
VLPHAVHIQPHVVGERDLLQQVVQAPRRARALASRRVDRGFREAIDAEFQDVRLFIFVLR